MSSVEDWPLFESAVEESLTDIEVLERFRREELMNRSRTIMTRVLPRSLVMMLLLTWLFLFKYYIYNCTQASDGSWVSTPVKLPKDVAGRVSTYFKGVFQDLLDFTGYQV